MLLLLPSLRCVPCLEAQNLLPLLATDGHAIWPGLSSPLQKLLHPRHGLLAVDPMHYFLHCTVHDAMLVEDRQHFAADDYSAGRITNVAHPC
uniref:Secreted protein n=1 Tax=Arundo donax TaxID=35708 RepID=A0A0A9BHX6_ARUDO